MGLDQYAFAVKKEASHLFEKYQRGFEGFTPEEQMIIDSGTYDIMYWRKHPNLQQWVIEHLGLNQDFNGGEMAYLDGGDIDAFEKAVNNDDLPTGEGFFWGVSRPEDKVKDLEFIKEARKALKKGYFVCYQCSW